MKNTSRSLYHKKALKVYGYTGLCDAAIPFGRKWRDSTAIMLEEGKPLRQVLFDLRVGNSNLAKSLGEKSNHAMYQDKNPHRCLLSLQN